MEHPVDPLSLVAVPVVQILLDIAIGKRDLAEFTSGGIEVVAVFLVSVLDLVQLAIVVEEVVLNVASGVGDLGDTADSVSRKRGGVPQDIGCCAHVTDRIHEDRCGGVVESRRAGQPPPGVIVERRST